MDGTRHVVCIPPNGDDIDIRNMCLSYCRQYQYANITRCRAFSYTTVGSPSCTHNGWSCNHEGILRSRHKHMRAPSCCISNIPQPDQIPTCIRSRPTVKGRCELFFTCTTIDKVIPTDVEMSCVTVGMCPSLNKHLLSRVDNLTYPALCVYSITHLVWLFKTQEIVPAAHLR